MELLEACIHHILASRSIYPDAIFTKRLFGPSHCGVPIMVSEHPDVNSFIIDGLSGLNEAINNNLLTNKIDQFDLVLIQNTEKGDEYILETYSFEFKFSHDLSGKCSDEATHLKDCDRVKTEQNIRAMILCLSSRMAELGKIRPKIKEVSETNYSFNFGIHTSEEGAKYLSDDLGTRKL